MTEYAYSRKLVCISEDTSMSTIRSVKSSSGGAVFLRAMRLFVILTAGSMAGWKFTQHSACSVRCRRELARRYER